MSPLPPAPEGSAYRPRSIRGEQYTTTGTFRTDAPDATLEHLVSAPALILDCDLVDFERGEAGTPAERKKALHALPQAELDTRIGELARCVSGMVGRLCGAPPSRIVSSGYGVHVYLWLSEADSLRVAEVRSANKALMLRVNEVAGFKLADPAVHDAGTRVLRVVGTTNTKNPAMPRPVVELHRADTVHDLERWLAVAPAPAPAPAPAKAVAPAPAKAVAPAPAKGKAKKAVAPAPAETADPFAAAYARASAALAWMLAEEEFFRWAQEHPSKIGRESWRGAAVNIAFLMGEGGRAAFHTFSALDPSRYDAPACDRFFDDALKSAEQGAIKYTTLAACGDWPGPVPDGEASPALRARATVKPAKAETAPPEPGEGLGLRMNKKGGYVPSLRNLRILMREEADEHGGLRQRHNSVSKCAELNGEPYSDDDAGDVIEYLDHKYGVAFPLPWVGQTLRNIAKKREYHPIKEWVCALAWNTDPCSDPILELLGAELNDLNRAYLRCFLVGAVARLFVSDLKRGVKMDTVLVLKGPQNIGKSMFFEYLADEFYNDSMIDVDSTDGYLGVDDGWIIEWAELDHDLQKHSQAAVKKFLTSKVDRYRAPYARTRTTVARRSVIVGTTNEDQFLRDSTGSRRFHVLETTKEIDPELLKSMRDQIWAEALHLYQNGAKWWLTKEEEALRKEGAEQYEVEEPWGDLVRKYVDDKHIYEDCNIDDVLMLGIGRAPENYRPGDKATVGRILKKLGFVQERGRVNGVLTRSYKRPRPPGEATNLVPFNRFTPPPAPSRRAVPLAAAPSPPLPPPPTPPGHTRDD